METLRKSPLGVSEPVKIYEPKSANKTWRNSSDLECLSVGEDLLAFEEFTGADTDSQLQDLIEHRLWKDSAGKLLMICY